MVRLVANVGLRSGAGRQRLRAMSKTVFGNADRLEVAEAVADSPSGVVNGQELHERLGISPPRVRAQLLALRDASLVRALPKVGLRQDYELIDREDPFWALVSQVAKAWRESE